jgi:hypothetical protein
MMMNPLRYLLGNLFGALRVHLIFFWFYHRGYLYCILGRANCGTGCEKRSMTRRGGL